MKYCSFLFFLVFINCCCFKDKTPGLDHIKIIDWENNGIQSKDLYAIDFLKKTNLKFEQNSDYIILYNNKKTVTTLIKLRKAIEQNMWLISENIRNATNINTSNGKPFQRKILKINEDGEATIISDDSTPFRLIYDPGHPSAYKSGRQKGYVEYPNVNATVEMVNWISQSRLLRQVENILIKFDPYILIINDDVFNQNECNSKESVEIRDPKLLR